MAQLLPTEERHEQAGRVTELIELLESFLDGRVQRLDIARWAAKQWTPGTGQGGPFQRHPAACVVFDSIWNIEDCNDQGPLVRREDVAGYLDWLTRGAVFDAEGYQPLVMLALSLDTLRSMTRTREVRYWLDGVGWQWELRFASAATGRGFLATAPLAEASRCGIFQRRTDDATLAAEDLIESLVLAGPEITYWDERVEPGRLPQWSLCRQDDNGQRYEMTTFLSYTRALREADVFERRGHKQSYWVERKHLAR